MGRLFWWACCSHGVLGPCLRGAGVLVGRGDMKREAEVGVKQPPEAGRGREWIVFLNLQQKLVLPITLVSSISHQCQTSDL